MKVTRLLAIESSCDETAVAIIAESAGEMKLESSVISSQIEIHREHGGVVPELASRNHSLRLPRLIQACLDEADCSVDSLDGIAATAGPGLASSLLIGLTAAKGMAIASAKPFYAINHLEGHLLSPFLTERGGFRPNLSLIVSGGHTMLVDCADIGQYQLIGKSRDDAAGEAFDKVGKMLGLPYPGGPEIEKCARRGRPDAFDLPRSMLRRDEFDFSFSGLKTAVLYLLPPLVEKFRAENPGSEGGLLEQDLNDLCASFQSAVVDVLVRKVVFAAKKCGRKVISVSGGVSCNGYFREALQTAADKHGLELLVPAPALTTDNAGMIAYVALEKHKRGLASSMADDIDPNLPLTVEGNRAKKSKKS